MEGSSEVLSEERRKKVNVLGRDHAWPIPCNVRSLGAGTVAWLTAGVKHLRNNFENYQHSVSVHERRHPVVHSTRHDCCHEGGQHAFKRLTSLVCEDKRSSEPHNERASAIQQRRRSRMSPLCDGNSIMCLHIGFAQAAFASRKSLRCPSIAFPDCAWFFEVVLYLEGCAIRDGGGSSWMFSCRDFT